VAYFAEGGFVDGEWLDWGRDELRCGIGFVAKFVQSVCEVTLFVEGAVSLLGVVPADEGFKAFLLLVHVFK
jgi:hypothetical protein